MKLRDMLAVLRQRFSEAGIESAEAEAEILLSECLNLRRPELFLHYEEELALDKETRLNARCQRREKHEPLQYLLEKAPFLDLELRVTPAVLIPRPETELLAEWAAKQLPHGGKMLDLGCGSGAIALGVASLRPDAEILGVDVSDKALAVAEENRRAGNFLNVKLRQSDLFENVEETFDLIAANLPYVTDEEYMTLSKEVRCHEPVLALTAPDEGFALIERAAREMPSRLKAAGQCGFELAPAQAPRLASLLRELRFTEIKTHRDYPGRERFVTARTEIPH